MARELDGGADSVERLAEAESIWADALLAARLFAIDPHGLGGIALRCGAGPVRERWLEAWRAELPDGLPVGRMPASIADDRLFGGLDLAGTLAAGRPVHRRGLIADCDGGVVIAAMAERIGGGAAAALSKALDIGVIGLERDGISEVTAARIGVVALDEGADEDERLPAALADRLAFHVDLTGVPLRAAVIPSESGPAGFDGEARVGVATSEDPSAASVGAVCTTHADCEAMTATALAFGIVSLRAPLLALRAAKAAAFLRGAAAVAQSDLELAARLVLAPRATQLPAESPDDRKEPEPEEADEPPDTPPEDSERDDKPESDEIKGSLEDTLVDAVRAAIPAQLLATLAAGALAARGSSRTSGSAGAKRRSKRRGRPVGVGTGRLGDGARLSVVDTLRAAAPWQRLRAGGRYADASRGAVGRLAIRPEDFRFRRYADASEALTVFVVDASGSAALNRLGEAKGAVELLLADCYVRRDHIALVAMRGRSAEVLLPSTRALARAKRSLAALPGGGGTPLAAGLEHGLMLALAGRHRDQQPTIVVLTDGAANVARDGTTGRRAGQADALAAARAIRGMGVPALLIDSSPRPSAFAAELADTMAAKYFALPMAGAEAVSTVVKAARPVG